MMSAMPRNALNPTDSPVIIDEDGTQIDGKSTGKVDPEHPYVVAALAAGALLFATQATEPGEPAGRPDPEVLQRAAELAGDPPPRKAAAAKAGGKTQEA